MKRILIGMIVGVVVGISAPATAGFWVQTRETTTARPACAAGTRGKIWFTDSALGVIDVLSVCRKSALDVYAWVDIPIL